MLKRKNIDFVTKSGIKISREDALDLHNCFDNDRLLTEICNLSGYEFPPGIDINKAILEYVRLTDRNSEIIELKAKIAKQIMEDVSHGKYAIKK